MQRHTVPALAKVNLFLHVTGRRSGGYHELETLVTFCQDLADEITLSENNTNSFSCSGECAHLIDPNDNLCTRARDLMQKHFKKPQPISIELNKYLPVSAGLGGGSADAAAVIRGLAQMWGIDPDDPVLYKIALKLGADVPMCLHQKNAMIRGIGEQITPCALPRLHLALINPRKSCCTKEVFDEFDESHMTQSDTPEQITSYTALLEFLKQKDNQLTRGTKKIIPDVAEIHSALDDCRGCDLVRMSGSGATCFGVFKNHDDAVNAAAQISRQRPEWWSKAITTI